ncbi:hypothetical protein [Actinoplanes derwentensis]|uniref:Uncharacterized protein n=1 Tax=Actinoplanes derwentensis TaxID=113562 RepID=A0A1H1YUR3_9ACTN|nr:hypothetical protein [Actinoplanes derwentensis]GID81295.1 hypothetical protein Ade03nite_02190 [Actinoplanes derwentensis]SDT25039.1 hypothetical protein SAMN04489716_3003 [Actinoplanes derwentensis]
MRAGCRGVPTELDIRLVLPPLLSGTAWSTGYWRGIVTLTAVALALALIRARALRLREHAADQVAGRRGGGPEPVTAMPAGATEPTGGMFLLFVTVTYVSLTLLSPLFVLAGHLTT